LIRTTEVASCSRSLLCFSLMGGAIFKKLRAVILP